MREIKFRAWDRGKMISAQHRISISEGVAWIGGKRRGCDRYIRSGAILMQYTGLKDNKRTVEYPEGQEIYEGDILKFSKTIDIGIVGYCVGAFHISVNGIHYLFGDIESYYHKRNKEHEVIGNIYESPELINPLTS